MDTQLDFLYPAGALAVPGAQDIVEPLIELTRFAAASHIQIVSTADAHSADDPEFQTWRPHCVAGTIGQKKIAGTLLNQRLVVNSDPHALDAIHPVAGYAPQIIIEKQTIDCFTNPNLHPLLDLLKADRYLVYGVATEVCVRCAAFGLLETGARVELVTDAIKSLSSSDQDEIVGQFQAQGGQLTTVGAVTASD